MKTNKWKLSLLIWSAMFPFSTLITYGLAQLPFTAHWPLVARTFCLTCLLVPYMVFVALPFITRRFQTWILNSGQVNTSAGQPVQTLPVQPTGFRAENDQTESRESGPGLTQTGVKPNLAPPPFQLNRMA